MADGFGDYRTRSRDYGRDYGRRESSIFSDDDNRWRGNDRERSRSRDDRGFIDRAGDEVRSWFGDDEAERRRERDARYDEGRYGEQGRGGRERFDYDRQRMSNRATGGSDRTDRDRSVRQGGGGMAGSRSFGGSRAGYGEDRDRSAAFGTYSGARGDMNRDAGWDDNYRRWRDQQIEQLDREYDEYCRHRQQKFETDFHSWRETRTGKSEKTSGKADKSSDATTRSTVSEGAGATGSGSGKDSETGSTTGSNRSRSKSGS